MNKTKNYTAADFARYHEGTMPAAEMHALENAALEDPFLGDALEGYAFTSSPSADADALRERLNVLSADKKIFFLSPKAGWWRIAALLVIIAGAGVLFFTVNNKISKNNGLAQNETNTPVASVVSDTAPFLKPDTSVVQIPENKVTKGTAVVSSIRSVKPAEIQAQYNSDAVSAAPESNTQNVSVVPEQIAGIKNNNQGYNNAAQQNNAIQYKDVFNKPALKSDQSWTKNNADQKEDDRRAEMEVYRNNTAKKLQVPAPVAQSANNGLQEVITAAGINRKAKGTIANDGRVKNPELTDTLSMPKALADMSTMGASQKVSAKNIDVGINGTSALPGNGMSPQEKIAFDQYLEKNIRPVYNSAGVRMAGEVLLSFSINKKGRPKDIKVAMSLCTPCEAQAIKLLENGPDWSGKKNEEKTVIIKFKQNK